MNIGGTFHLVFKDGSYSVLWDKVSAGMEFEIVIKEGARPMKKVIIESPYAGDIERNVRYARACVRDSVLRGEAPIASHLLFTQPGILDDNVPEERSASMAAGHAWIEDADLLAVYTDLGLSDGMKHGIMRANRERIAIEFRTCTIGIKEEPAPQLFKLHSRNTLREYGRINLARAMRWHKGGLEEWSIADWGIAVGGEAGELLNAIKKMRRVEDRIQGHDGDTPQPKHLVEAKLAVKKEIGDVYAYLDLVAQRFGLDLWECARDTFNQISEREGFPERMPQDF